MSPAQPGKRRRGPGPFTISALLGLAFILANVVFVIFPKLDAARKDRAELDLENIGSALKIFHWKQGRYPKETEGLRAMVDAGALEHRCGHLTSTPHRAS